MPDRLHVRITRGGGLKVVKPKDIGGADVSDTVPPEPVPDTEVFVAVAMPPGDDEGFYISVHSTKGGAHARIHEKAEEWAAPIQRLVSHVGSAIVETP